MPSSYQLATEYSQSDFVFDTAKLLFERTGIKLIPTDDNGEYSLADGKYRDDGVIEFPNVVIRALTELWSLDLFAGFVQDDDGNDLGSVGYQISNDNGGSYLYHNGSAWATAGANDWNSLEEVQTNISSFPFASGSYRQLRLKLKLSPDSDGIATPSVLGFAIHYEIEYVPEEDVIKSLVEKINSEVRVTTEGGVVLAGASTSFRAPYDVKIASVIGVWNLSSDPGRLTNIYSSLVQSLVSEAETGEEVWEQTINMSASQAKDSDILVRLVLEIPIFIAPDDDYSFSSLPQFIIEIGSFAEDMDFRDDAKKVERNQALLRGRVRKNPPRYRIPFVILSSSSDDLLTNEMNRALSRLLENKFVRSLATGDRMRILAESTFASSPVIKEDLSVKRFSFQILALDLQGDYEEVDLVSTVVASVDYEGGPNESS